jgi:hypothetical protein
MTDDEYEEHLRKHHQLRLSELADWREELTDLLVRGEITSRDRDLHRLTLQVWLEAGLQGRHGRYVKAGKVEGPEGRPAKSGSWQSRIKHHRRIARVHGFALVGVWVSPPIANSRSAESLLLAELDESHHERGLRERNRDYLHHGMRDGEYFLDMRFDDAVPIANDVLSKIC